VEKEITMVAQSLAETLRQDSLKRAERDEALAQYIRAALATWEAEASRAAQQTSRHAAGRLVWVSRLRALARISS
jgi:hypothetical protein